MDKPSKLSKNNWLVMILFGLLGQIAWCIENNYLNVFIDRTITTNSFAIAFMVAASAIIATLTTLIMGVISDKRGKRARFMSFGYIIWGVTIMLFSVITVKNIAGLFGCDNNTAIILSVVAVVIMDCIMTFFGSTANDAAFNAWVTDVTDDTNRGFVDSILGIMAVLAYAIMFGVFDSFTQNTYYDALGNAVSDSTQAVTTVFGNWTLFYCILGVLVLAVGIAGIFVVKDKPSLKPNPQYNVRTIFYGFKPAVIKENKELYLVLSCIAIVGIANMSFAPYLIIYIERTLEVANYIIPYGIIFGLSAIGSLVIGKIMDKRGNKLRFIIPGVIIYIAGALAMYLVSPVCFEKTPIAFLCAVGFVQSIGNYMISIACTATVRNLTPKDKVGLFQGVRMIFSVLIPMCVGPLITAIINTANVDNIIGYDTAGQPIYIYSPAMFLIAAAVVVFTLIPALLLIKNQKAQLKEEKQII